MMKLHVLVSSSKLEVIPFLFNAKLYYCCLLDDCVETLVNTPFRFHHVTPNFIYVGQSPLGLVLYCYLNMPTINKAYLILSYLILSCLVLSYLYKEGVILPKNHHRLERSAHWHCHCQESWILQDSLTWLN